MPVPLLNLAARTATALRLLIARFPWSRPMGSSDRGALQGNLRAVPAASQLQHAEKSASWQAPTAFTLAGSGLSLRDSGFALWPACYRKKSAAARGSI